MPQAVFAWEPVRAEDGPALAELRVLAMRPSLEAVGRFDPVRARARLLDDFDPECTRAVSVDGRRVGFAVLRPQPDHWRLDHLYIHPDMQGCGIGTKVLLAVMAQAQQAGRDLCLSALRGSRANAFYRGHGFCLVGESEWDLHYRWAGQPMDTGRQT